MEDSGLFQSATCELVPLASTGAESLGAHPSTVRGVAILEVASVQAFYVSGLGGEATRDAGCAWVRV